MASSSSSQNSQRVPGSSFSIVERYEEPSRTLLTSIDSLEVLCKLIIDFESRKENNYDLTPDVEFQGWTRYFDRLLGPVFPKLVKEFWIHATTSNHQVTSYMMGKKISISEDLIARLISHNGGGIYCSEREHSKASYTSFKIQKGTRSHVFSQRYELSFMAYKHIINVTISHSWLSNT